MVKAKDFFKVLCEELNYRFFSGVVCGGLSKLFNAMDSSFMHYVPAADENIALGLVSGTAMSGLGSVLVIDMKLKEFVYPNFNFLIQNKLPVIIIAYSENKKEIFKYDIPIVYFKDLDDLKVLSNKIDKKSTPGLLIIGRDILK